MLHKDDDRIVLRNYENNIFVYREAKQEEEEKNNIKIEVSKGKAKTKEPKKYKKVLPVKAETLHPN